MINDIDLDDLKRLIIPKRIIKKIMTIAVDFDGTIVTHEYPKIGRDIPFAIATLKRLQKIFR